MDTIVNKGYITMTSYVKVRSGIPNLIIDFNLNSCKLDERERHLINKLSVEKNFKRILSADVELHFKIAKILCN